MNADTRRGLTGTIGYHCKGKRHETCAHCSCSCHALLDELDSIVRNAQDRISGLYA